MWYQENCLTKIIDKVKASHIISNMCNKSLNCLHDFDRFEFEILKSEEMFRKVDTRVILHVAKQQEQHEQFWLTKLVIVISHQLHKGNRN